MNIREQRKKKGWTQEDLAFRIGMDRTSVNRMENGKQPISKTVRLALERVFEN